MKEKTILLKNLHQYEANEWPIESTRSIVISGFELEADSEDLEEPAARTTFPAFADPLEIEPDLNSSLYISPVKISSLSDVVIRVFDINGRGGNSINIKQK